MAIEYLDTDTTILLVDELQNNQVQREYCCNQCTGEDIFLSSYIIIISVLLFGACLFIVIWFFIHV